MRPRVIVLTSFGGFPGAPVNPTEAIAMLAARRCAGRLQRLGIRLAHVHLPVDFARIKTEIAALFATHRPQAVLHLGLAARRKTLTPELQALNRISLRYPDASGAHATRGLIAPGAPDFLTATAPALRLVHILQGCGIDARVSRNAGAYVCNQTLYLSLLAARGGHRACRVGFIHLPQPSSRLTLRRMSDGVVACLIAMARPC